VNFWRKEYLKIPETFGVNYDDGEEYMDDLFIEVEPEMIDEGTEYFASEDFDEYDESGYYPFVYRPKFFQYAEDVGGDTKLTSEIIAERCSEIDVDFKFSEEVTQINVKDDKIIGIETDKGKYTADHYVIATGASVSLLDAIGLQYPIYPIKGYSLEAPLITEDDIWIPGTVITYNHSMYSRIGQYLRISSFSDVVGYDMKPDPGRELELKGLLEKYIGFGMRSVDEENIQFYQFLRAVSGDDLPLIGKAEGLSNLWLNMGHGYNDWTLSFGSAFILSSLMSKVKVPFDVSRFDPNRFFRE